MAFYRLRLHTRLSPADAMQRLASSVRDEFGFGEMLSGVFSFDSVPSNEYFIGEVHNDRFSVHRNIRYRNSFLPVIKGRITPEFPGSLIETTMRLNAFAALFMVLWLGTSGYGTLMTLAKGGSMRDASMLAGMFVFGILFMAVGFVPEAIKARTKLISLLQAETADPARRPTVSR